MRRGWLAVLLLGVCVAASGSAQDVEATRLEIIEPTPDAIVLGRSLIRVRVGVPDDQVRSLQFFVDGRLTCTAEAPPWQCSFDAGSATTSRHVRVVGRFGESDRAVANVRTKALGFAEAVRVSAVQVPIVVRDGDGRFLRGLGVSDFVVKEDGVAQALTQVANESVALEVILAIDISASMFASLGEVTRASIRFVDRLRLDDAATILAFNDSRFIVADTEKDPARRRAALAGLKSWGSTAIYDTMNEALDLAARGSGRKGIVMFTDGEDQASRITSDSVVKRIQQSEAMVYTIAFGTGLRQPSLREELESYAKASGGRVFFPRNEEQLDAAFTEIIDELSSQYLLSYEPTPSAGPRGWRRLEVDVRRSGARVRARDGYLSGG